MQDTIEKNLTNMYSNEYVLGVSSGTSAIIISLMMGKYSKDSEVIIPSIACPAVLSAVSYCNLKPVFVDMEIEYFNMSIESIAQSITEKTVAIIGVHSYGITANISEIQKTCNEKNILLIEDCCLSIGNKINNQKIGTFGDISIFSFRNDKIIGGAGGALLFKNKNNFLDAKISLDENKIFNQINYDEKNIDKEFKNLDENIYKRNQKAKKFSELIVNKNITKPKYRDSDVYWRYPALVKNNRKDLLEKSRKENIVITYHYPSLAKFQYNTFLPIADRFDKSVINFFVNETADEEYIEKVAYLVDSHG